MTPPAMAPTFGPEDSGAGLGLSTHVMYAHVLQSSGTSEQIWLSLQLGHDGACGGHSMQRLKIVRKARSASAGVLVGGC